MIASRLRLARARTSRILALGIAIAGFALSGAARAACVDASSPFKPTSGAPSGAARLSDTVYRPGTAGNLMPVWDYQGDEIVGTWKFEWRAKASASAPNDNPGIPDGALLDFGTIQWHDDGTEITISGGRTPAVGDVCMGSWRYVGHSTYKLTHLAMGYGPPPGPATGYSGLAVLEMTVTVDPGSHSYHGSFALTQYASKFNPTVPNSEFDTSSVEFTLTGTVKGARLEAN
jgi:hypothetical protein